MDDNTALVLIVLGLLLYWGSDTILYYAAVVFRGWPTGDDKGEDPDGRDEDTRI